ncbi:hypothetical protein LTR86_010997 [Recurvomyces mirabilis]|nr:hypothetical protein LTR86_010997 [Recurvomyces mirabilis]
MDTLSKDLDRLNLQAPKVVAFDPSTSKHNWNFDLDPIPRYLFRVYDQNSPGLSDGDWVKSKDLVQGAPEAGVDVFCRDDRTELAHQIWGHLMWKGLKNDNLMSWTSSLLFVIQYIFYRYNRQSERPTYNSIKLCVLDTQGLPQGAFIRDLNLIGAFAPFDRRLQQVHDLRSGPHYFGEYLSQGALRVQGHNTIVSAHDLIDRGVLSLRPEFENNFNNPHCGWAKDVVAMYKILEQDLSRPKPCHAPSTVRQAIDIASLLEGDFRVHVARKNFAEQRYADAKV